MWDENNPNPRIVKARRLGTKIAVGAMIVGAPLLLGSIGSNGAIQPLQPAKPKIAKERAYSERDLECLALNVYWEARSEGREAQLAIAHVTMNRVNDPEFPDDVCSVVQEGGHARRHRCQFSWWCDGRSDRPADREAWAAARALSRDVLAGRTKDPTRGAVYFHRSDVKPSWAKVMEHRCDFGRHRFYAEADADA
jgi:spore germination cell wall hydrolase CwlJ-like protein